MSNKRDETAQKRDRERDLRRKRNKRQQERKRVRQKEKLRRENDNSLSLNELNCLVKRAFPSEVAALRNKPIGDIRIYHCPLCEHWHFTSSNPSSSRRRRSRKV